MKSDGCTFLLMGLFCYVIKEFFNLSFSIFGAFKAAIPKISFNRHLSIKVTFWTLQTYLQIESGSLPWNGYFPQSLLLFEETDYQLYWTEQAWANDSSYLWLQRHFKTFLIMIKWHKTYYLGNQRKVLSYHTWKEFPSTVSKDKQNTLVPTGLFGVLCQKHSYFIACVLTKVENYQWTPKEKSYQFKFQTNSNLNSIKPSTKNKTITIKALGNKHYWVKNKSMLN